MSSNQPTPQPVSLEAALVARARSGDAQAFDRLADMYWTRLYRLVRVRVGGDQDAEDLAQDTLVRAYEGLDGLQEDERFQSWLFRIALNLVRDHYRRQGVRRVVRPLGEDEEQTLVDPDQGPDPEGLERVFHAEVWGRVEDFLATLPAGERDAFSLRYLDQLGVREVAETLGRSQSTIKTQLGRAVVKFKQDQTLIAALRGEI